MEVIKSIQPDKNLDYHSIEWGYGTWAKNLTPKSKHRSIRNRYDKDDGGFNVRGSSEVPWQDFNLMIEHSLIHNQFTKKEVFRILNLSLKKAFQNFFKKGKK